MATSSASARSGGVWERGKRVSQSCIWDALAAFYRSEGINAWKAVPNYITSNSFIANSYAQVIFALVYDYISIKDFLVDNEGEDEGEQVVNIVELGSGTGKFAYLLLKHLTASLEANPPLHPKSRRPIKFRYVMTDFHEEIIHYWRNNGYFTKYVERGILDFAVFDCNKDDRINLIVSKKVISPTNPSRLPIVYIANYVLDSLPADAFEVRNGNLYEVLLSVYSSSHVVSDPEFIQNSSLRWSRKHVSPVESVERKSRSKWTSDSDERTCKYGYYKDDARANDILEKYRSYFSSTSYNCEFQMPVGATRLLQVLSNLSKGRFSLIAADKGFCMIDEWAKERKEAVGFDEIEEEEEGPHFATHGGAFSFMANLHALGAYFEATFPDSICLHSISYPDGFKISCFVSSNPSREAITNTSPDSAFRVLAHKFPLTRNSFQQFVNSFGPSGYFKLYRNINPESVNPEFVLAILQQSCHDSDMFYKFADTLANKLGSCKEDIQQELVQELLLVWAHHYHQPTVDKDVAFAMGEILLTLNDKEKLALEFFQTSEKNFGYNYSTIYNMATCYHNLDRIEDALRCCDVILRHEPADPDTLEFRAQLLQEKS